MQGTAQSHRASRFLPGGRRFLYFSEEGFYETVGQVHIGSIDLAPDDQDPTSLLEADSPAEYIPAVDRFGVPTGTGYLLFVRRGSLLAQPFDASDATLQGDPMQIVSGAGPFSAVATALVYRTGGDATGPLSQLIKFDRGGRQIEVVGPPAVYGDLNMLADPRRLAVVRTDIGEPRHIQIVDLARAAFTRLNPGSVGDYATAPSPDGTVAFTSSAEGVLRDIYVRPANGVGDAVLLVESDSVKHPNGWSPDGRFLIYDDHRVGMAQDLFLVTKDGGEPIPFLATEADETFGQFSPDGNWIAYRSNESGRPEVYVRDFAPDQVPAYGNDGAGSLSRDQGRR